MKKTSKQFVALYKAARRKNPDLKMCEKAGHLLTPQNVFGGASLKKGLLHCVACDRIRKGVKAKSTSKRQNKSLSK
jgi:hypothetical protein